MSKRDVSGIEDWLGAIADSLARIERSMREQRSSSLSGAVEESLRVIAYEMVRARYDREGRGWSEDAWEAAAPLGRRPEWASPGTTGPTGDPGVPWRPAYEAEGDAAL